MVAFFDLPHEIVIEIVQGLATQKQDLLNFAITCRRARQLADPLLLHSIILRDASDVDRLDSLINDDFRRGEYVQNLKIVPRANENSKQFREAGRFATFINPRKLFVEIPFNSYPWSGRDTFDHVYWECFRNSFGQLEPWQTLSGRILIPNWCSRIISCHLNLQYRESSPYKGSEVLTIIAAPLIEELTLVNADLRNFNLELNRMSLRPHSSTLQTLHLLGCSFDETSISNFVSIPKALKACSYTPNIRYTDIDDFVECGVDELRHIVASLATHQYTTLTRLMLSLKCDAPYDPHEIIPQLCLSRLNQLSELRLKLYRRFIDSDLKCIFTHLPESLTKLSLCEYHRSLIFQKLPNLPSILNDNSDLMQHLQQLDLEIGYRRGLGLKERRVIEEMGSALKSVRNIRLNIIHRARLNYIRHPYSYGNRFSDLVVVYDNHSNEDLWDSLSEAEVQEKLEKNKSS